MNSTKSILLIEDDQDDQMFFIEALSEMSNVTLLAVADNGQAALAKLESMDNLPDIIFTDINMPFMDGLECLIQLSKNRRTANIPVYVLSSASEYFKAAINLGAKAFIKKPSDCTTLRTQIQQIVNLDSKQEYHVARHNLQTLFAAAC